MAEPLRVLAVAAHPDDEVLGVGGTLNLHARAGDLVTICILGRGERARGTTGTTADTATAALMEGVRTAALRLGAHPSLIYDFPDNAFDQVTLLSIVRTLEDVVARVVPDIVYTHHSGDLNVDHQLTCRAVVTACRPSALPAPALYSFEVRSATDFAGPFLQNVPFRPNVYQALDPEAVTAKLDALHCYEREMRPWPQSRSYEAVEAQLRSRGAEVGVDSAEAFMLLREVRSAIPR